eukprot:126523-Hanusia_phi.AAC.1
MSLKRGGGQEGTDRTFFLPWSDVRIDRMFVRQVLRELYYKVLFLRREAKILRSRYGKKSRIGY